MNPTRTFVASLLALAFVAVASAQTLTGYGVIKTYSVTQTSSGAPVAGSDPYSLSSYVFGSGLTGTYSFTAPGGSAQDLTIAGNGASADFSSGNYTTSGALNTAYAEGVYNMALPNINGAPQSAALPSFTGDAFPNSPTITSGTWSGGMLLIDPTQNFSLTFGALSGFSSDDSIKLQIDGIGTNYFANTSVTSFTIDALTLTAGQTYSASLRFNNNFIDYGTTIGGANGNSGFTTETVFQIQAIPEPSTYAAILGSLVLAGVVVRRRRCAV